MTSLFRSADSLRGLEKALSKVESLRNRLVSRISQARDARLSAIALLSEDVRAIDELGKKVPSVTQS